MGADTGARARTVVLVEGDSDAAVVRVLGAARGLIESAATYQIRAMGGVTNVGRHLRALQADALGALIAEDERSVRRP